MFRILNQGVLFLVAHHLLVHDPTRLVDDLVEKHDVALAGGHALYHPEVDVLERVGPRVFNKGEDLEELLKVEVLLGGDYVDHFVEMVLFVTFDGAANVAGEVEGGSVCGTYGKSHHTNQHNFCCPRPFFLTTAFPSLKSSKSTSFAPSDSLMRPICSIFVNVSF